MIQNERIFLFLHSERVWGLMNKQDDFNQSVNLSLQKAVYLALIQTSVFLGFQWYAKVCSPLQLFVELDRKLTAIPHWLYRQTLVASKKNGTKN